jgi:hypothetical protein
MGSARTALVRELGGRAGSPLGSHGRAMGLIRDGRTARHIGPLFADHVGSATALIEKIARSETAPILIDVESEHDEFLKNLTNSGWTIERPFQRMRFGRAATQSAAPPFAVAGPEYG